MTDRTCEPPPEHRDKAWHWLRWLQARSPTRAEWSGGRWVIPDIPDQTPTSAYVIGWRYVAPAVPPQDAGE